MIFLYVVSMIVVAAVANSTSRAWLLAVLFGESQPASLDIASIEAEDTATVYADNVYQVYYDGYSVIRWLTGDQARNLIAYGHTLAYVS